MCGIAGFIDFKNKSNKETLIKMTDVLHHRGPDDSGYMFKNFDSYSLGFGHRRLSILDLSKHGSQPMRYNDLIVVFNGEIYNFKEIKEELQSLGHKFVSNSDTEVILHSFEQWGNLAVERFNGMFAFALWDKNTEKIFIYRDRAGVKPLYWYFKEDLFMFSSELKSFHQNRYFKKEINHDSLPLLLKYGYILQPHTIFKHTYKLRAGHYLEISLKDKKIKEKKYWDASDYYNRASLKISEEEALLQLEKLLKSSFEYRMVSDVPVGVFLSGGYDSSAVVAILQKDRTEKIKTFTIGFHEKGYDEAPYAKKVAEILGTEHTEYYCTQKEAAEIIPLLPYIYDEPFGDSSAIPTILVSRLARKNVTVSLSADGGDEVFAGYNKYDTVLNYYEKFSKIPERLRPFLVYGMNRINPAKIPFLNKTYNFETRYEKVKAILNSRDIVDALKYTSWHFTDNEIKKLLKNKYKTLDTDFNLCIKNDDLNKMLAVDYKTYMVDDILTKVDRATMSISLEGREPLLDYRILEFVAGLPSDIKYKNGEKKYLLKKITHKYLPQSLMDRKKMGFAVPLFEWFKDDLKNYMLDYLSKERLKREGLFNFDEVIKLRDKYLSGSNENIRRLWFILMFEMWYEKWM